MSPEYLRAIEKADRCISHIIDRLPDDCAVMVTSDHGGHAQTHGTDSDEDMHVPLIFNCPEIPPGEISRPCSILDIAPTVADYLGVNPLKEWMGTSLFQTNPES